MLPITGNGIGPGGNCFGRMNILRYHRTASRKPPRKIAATTILKSRKKKAYLQQVKKENIGLVPGLFRPGEGAESSDRSRCCNCIQKTGAGVILR